MKKFLGGFLSGETGAITVDWVVLTAALVGLGLAVMSVVSGGFENLSADMGQTLADQPPTTNPFPDNATFTAGAGAYVEGTLSVPVTNE